MNLFYASIPKDYPLPNSNYKNSVLGCLTYNHEPLHEALTGIINIDDLTGLWGISTGPVNGGEYNKIRVGDVIFFRINTRVDGKTYQAFDGFGFISEKLSSNLIAKKVWGEDSYGGHLMLMDKYYRFYEPFLLSVKGNIVASVDGVPKEAWHKQYNMFRQWSMAEDAAKRLIDFFSNEDLSLNIYDRDAEVSDKTDTVISSSDISSGIERETETTVTKTERKGQDKFRRDLLSHTNKCEICGIDNEKLLVASHIKPWKASNNKERLDINNGLALCAIHDKLFDTGLISFSDNGMIQISSNLSKRNRGILNLSLKIKITLNKRKRQYMKAHREKHKYGG